MAGAELPIDGNAPGAAKQRGERDAGLWRSLQRQTAARCDRRASTPMTNSNSSGPAWRL